MYVVQPFLTLHPGSCLQWWSEASRLLFSTNNHMQSLFCVTGLGNICREYMCPVVAIVSLISLLIHLKVLKKKDHVPLVFLMDRMWYYQREAHTSPWVLPAVLNDLSLPSSALTINCNSQKQLQGCWNMPWNTLGSWWVVMDNYSLCLMLSHFILNSVTLFLLCVGKEGHEFLFWALNAWQFSEKLFW